MSPYSPKTGEKCSCRRGVERDNCPRCEGTGWVIDFKKIHQKRREDDMRKNAARWAGGYLDYQRRMNPRWDVGERVLFRRTRRRVRLPAHRHLNPYRRNPSIGGIGVGTLALLGVGGFLAYRYFTGGGSLFGPTAPASVPQGFVPIGSGLYRGPDGATYARNPTTGAMVRAPVGSQPPDAEALLTQAGIALIPQGANMLANWIGGLFGTQRTATTPSAGTTYATRPPTPSASTMPSSPLPSGVAAAIPALPGAAQILPSLWPSTTGTDIPSAPGVEGELGLWSGNADDAMAWALPSADLPTGNLDVMPTDSSWWDMFEGDGALVDSVPVADTGWMDWSQYDFGFSDVAFDVPDIPVPEIDYGGFDYGFMGFGRISRPPTTAVRGYGRRPASIG